MLYLGYIAVVRTAVQNKNADKTTALLNPLGLEDGHRATRDASAGNLHHQRFWLVTGVSQEIPPRKEDYLLYVKDITWKYTYLHQRVRPA